MKILHNLKTIYAIDENINKEDIDLTTYEQRDTSIQLHDYYCWMHDWERFFTHYYVANRLNELQIKTVIDFCSGIAVIMRALQRWCLSLKKYIAVDIDDKKLQKIGRWGLKRDWSTKNKWNFEIEKINLPLHKLPDIPTDAITYLFSVEHMKEELAVASLKRAHELLPKDGRLFITFPNNDVHESIPKAHLKRWGFMEAINTLKTVGFEILQVNGLMGKFGPIKHKAKQFEEYIPRDILQCMFYFHNPQMADEFLIEAVKDKPQPITKVW